MLGVEEPRTRTSFPVTVPRAWHPEVICKFYPNLSQHEGRPLRAGQLPLRIAPNYPHKNVAFSQHSIKYNPWQDRHIVDFTAPDAFAEVAGFAESDCRQLLIGMGGRQFGLGLFELLILIWRVDRGQHLTGRHMRPNILLPGFEITADPRAL
jgi:hypothetical protein